MYPLPKTDTNALEWHACHPDRKSNKCKRGVSGGYNLFKYRATSNGILTVYTTGDQDTYGTLWNSDLSKILTSNDDEDDSNFQFTYEVEKGEIYYIGVRSYDGYAIDGDYQLTIKPEESDGDVVLVGTLDGKDIMGTKQGNDYIVASFDPTADFVLSEGIFYPADANAQLKPMRWYLNAVDSGTDMGINSGSSSSDTGSEDDTALFSRSIDITIVDGDPTTGIDDIHVITEQAAGSLSTGSRRGIYDLQGRKLSKEPKSGIYIKDGKKMVR